MDDKKEIRAILFDIGGVMISDVDPSQRMEVAKAFGVTTSQAKAALAENNPLLAKGKITEIDFWNRVSSTLKKGLPDDVENLWYNIMKRHMRVNKETKALSKKLRDAGYRTGVLSNTEPSHVRYMKEVNLFDGYDPTIFSCDVGHMKPEREIFLIALERLGLSPEQVVFTDNVNVYVEASKKAGINAYLFSNAANFEKWLKAMGLEF